MKLNETLRKEAIRDLNGMLKYNTHPFREEEINGIIDILKTGNIKKYKKDIKLFVMQIKHFKVVNPYITDTMEYTISYINYLSLKDNSDDIDD